MPVADSDRRAVPVDDMNPKTYHFAATGSLDAAPVASREADRSAGGSARSRKVTAAPR